MAEANWYVVHTYSGYENKVKANIEKTIENRHLEEMCIRDSLCIDQFYVFQVLRRSSSRISKKNRRILFHDAGYDLYQCDYLSPDHVD